MTVLKQHPFQYFLYNMASGIFRPMVIFKKNNLERCSYTSHLLLGWSECLKDQTRTWTVPFPICHLTPTLKLSIHTHSDQSKWESRRAWCQRWQRKVLQKTRSRKKTICFLPTQLLCFQFYCFCPDLVEVLDGCFSLLILKTKGRLMPKQSEVVQLPSIPQMLWGEKPIRSLTTQILLQRNNCVYSWNSGNVEWAASQWLVFQFHHLDSHLRDFPFFH